MTSTGLETGIVVSSHHNRVLILDADHQPVRCAFRHGKDRAVTGDRVEWRRIDEGEGLLVKVCPRRSVVYRPTEHGAGKPVAANVDQFVLVVAPTPVYLPRLIDRCLVTATYLDIPACLVFNKVDLLDKSSLCEAHATLDLYARIKIPYFWVSATKGTGIETLATFLQSKSAILVGQSGVGKSSITRSLTTDADIAVQGLSSRGAVGRHTTSHTTLYPLSNRGWIMDSPGVREFALWQIPPHDIAGGFLEFRPFLGKCRFRDCLHDAEPGCAIAQAAAQGSISGKRLDSYREMINQPESAQR